MEILLAFISASASIIVAIIGGWFALAQSKIKKEADAEREQERKRAEQRKKESLLSMQMVNANTELTICMALNMVRDIPLCDIEQALEKAQRARDDYNHFLEELGKENIL